MNTHSTRRGTLTYSDEHGNVCSCTEAVTYDDDGYPEHASYLPTVKRVRSVEPTETGSYYYACERCGASGWSGL